MCIFFCGVLRVLERQLLLLVQGFTCVVLLTNHFLFAFTWSLTTCLSENSREDDQQTITIPNTDSPERAHSERGAQDSDEGDEDEDSGDGDLFEEEVPVGAISKCLSNAGRILLSMHQ